MTETSSGAGDQGPSVLLRMELAVDPVPKGRLSGQDIDLVFDGWMQLLAAIEEALSNAFGEAARVRARPGSRIPGSPETKLVASPTT